MFAASLLAAACGGRPAAAPSSGAGCGDVAALLEEFHDAVPRPGETKDAHVSSYAKLVEMLLRFETATSDLGARLQGLKAKSSRADVAQAADAVEEVLRFASRGRQAVDAQVKEAAPIAKAAKDAWTTVIAACDGKKRPPECAELLARLGDVDGEDEDAATALARIESLRIGTPALARARDRGVQATRAFRDKAGKDLTALREVTAGWRDASQKAREALDALSSKCASSTRLAAFVGAERPDPRKLTVLVRVRPPAGVESALGRLGAAAQDPEDRAFFEARSKGAFGSGFVIVRPTAAGPNESLVITNRHVVELGDRAELELADGTALGPAEIVYADTLHDVAILRAVRKLPMDAGFSFAKIAAKDQQVVVASGFPGVGGRPSYQTTRGYVSNESFRTDDGPKPSAYVQHTAPIDPGSSGGPLTDERGQVLGINTLKVSSREAVALAIPAASVLEALARSDTSESRRANGVQRRADARLACLALVSEIGASSPRLETLEAMIGNRLTASEGLDAALGLMDDASFAEVWEYDSVRAMRVAALVRVRTAFLAGGGPSAFETCTEVDPKDSEDILSTDDVRFRVKTARGDVREIAFRLEQGRYRLSRFEGLAKIWQQLKVTAKPTRPAPRPTRPRKR